MNKKLLALAVAGAFAAPVAAMADSGNVTIYGQMNMSYDYVDGGKASHQAAAPTPGVDDIRQGNFNSNSSRIGFKGTEDLGNGLSAVWQLESTLTPDTAATTGFGGRNSFVGLSGKSWGTIILGKHDTPYKIATRSLDNFADGIADNRSIMGTAGAHDARLGDVVAYVSPDLSGFSAAAAYAHLNENQSNSVTGGLASNNKQGKAYSLMGKYANGPLMASVAYQRLDIGGDAEATVAKPDSAVETRSSAWKVGVGYNFGAFDVGAIYERFSDDLNKNKANPLNNNGVCGAKGTPTAGFTPYTGSECGGQHNWHLTGKYTFGSNAVKLAYTQASDMAYDSETGAKQWSVGFDHNFSKRTTAYALYTKLNNDDRQSYALGGAATSNGAVSVSSNQAAWSEGASQSAWSFGLKHSF